MTGNLDAKKACTGAMKLHKKYLKKVMHFFFFFLLKYFFCIQSLLQVYQLTVPMNFAAVGQEAIALGKAELKL